MAMNETEENFMVDDYRMCIWLMDYGVTTAAVKSGGTRCYVI